MYLVKLFNHEDIESQDAKIVLHTVAGELLKAGNSLA